MVGWPSISSDPYAWLLSFRPSVFFSLPSTNSSTSSTLAIISLSSTSIASWKKWIFSSKHVDPGWNYPFPFRPLSLSRSSVLSPRHFIWCNISPGSSSYYYKGVILLHWLPPCHVICHWHWLTPSNAFPNNNCSSSLPFGNVDCFRASQILTGFYTHKYMIYVHACIYRRRSACTWCGVSVIWQPARQRLISYFALYSTSRLLLLPSESRTTRRGNKSCWADHVGKTLFNSFSRLNS